MLSRSKRALASSLLVLIALLAPGTHPTDAQEAALNIGPAPVRQGDPLFVRLKDPQAQSAEVTWRGKSYPMYRQDSGWAAVLPVVPDTPPGGYRLVVGFKRDGRPQQVARKVEVARVAFPVQRLKMVRTRASLYNYPGVEKEEVPLSRALRVKSDERLWRGDWILPAKGRLSTPYGVRRIRNGKAVGRHRGTDIAAPTGTPVVAPAAGRVVLAETAAKFKKYGGTVVLDHGQGVTSMYIHMSAVLAREGQVLQPGTTLGRVGSEGVATGPHLHWSVYAQGQSIAPLTFVRLSTRGVRW